MEPPSYEEARLHPSTHIPPPPSYDASFPSPSTPPPTYGEAVTFQTDPFPILTPPVVPAAATSRPQNTGVIIHPPTQVGVIPSISSTQTQPAVVVQPPPDVSVSLTHLRDIPCVVRCPRCRRVVTSKVTYYPGQTAWCLCGVLTFAGLVCGFCLIPLMVRSLQDAYHNCPECGYHLHTHER
uniref:lipopolysaccharide-induced tumor necrosis factor-alpha factor homolog n=1 Tax=Scatophagus argus TaxID=75038 RepID=UPI001ED7FE7D|nr:lipopolysaccharide-induced tumor necrosis factor-alpha factor homolog [Scatophagus argus]